MAEPDQKSKLAAALAKAQAEMEPAGRTQESESGTKKYRYPDLCEVQRVMVPVLKNGISVKQNSYTQKEEDGSVCVGVKTILTHGESGEEWESDWFRLWTTQDPHAIGSAKTYAQRYSLMPALMISAQGEDDDGQKARTEQPKPQQKPRITTKPDPQPEKKEQPAEKAEQPDPKKRQEPEKQPEAAAEAAKPQGGKVNVEKLKHELRRLPVDPAPAQAKAALLSVLQAWPDDQRDLALQQASKDPKMQTWKLKEVPPEATKRIFTTIRQAAVKFLGEDPKQTRDPNDDFEKAAGEAS